MARYFNEVDEIDDEDLEAASDFFDVLTKRQHSQHQAERIAKERYGIVLDDKTLAKILRLIGPYSSIESCVSTDLRNAGLI